VEWFTIQISTNFRKLQRHCTTLNHFRSVNNWMMHSLFSDSFISMSWLCSYVCNMSNISILPSRTCLVLLCLVRTTLYLISVVVCMNTLMSPISVYTLFIAKSLSFFSFKCIYLLKFSHCLIDLNFFKQTRYCYKYRHVDGQFVLKVTDDHVVSFSFISRVVLDQKISPIIGLLFDSITILSFRSSLILQIIFH
jgi:hypothetical protein